MKNKIYSEINVLVKNTDLDKSNIIYMFIFPNGKVYIGQTIQKLRKRLQDHCRSKEKTIKQYAINKYKTFSVEVLYEGNNLNEQETYWINHYKSTNREFGYNLESGGRLNKIVSEETKKKMSEAQIGRIVSNETKEKCKKAAFHRPIIITEIATGIEIRFEYTTDAAEYFNISHKTIWKAASGGLKTICKKQYTVRFE